MGDAFDQISPDSSPTQATGGDVFDRIAPDRPTLTPPGVPRPSVNMQKVDLLTGSQGVPLNTQLSQTATSAVKNIGQVSTPGILTSLLQKTAPGIAAHLPTVATQNAAPLSRLPQQIVTTAAPMMAGDEVPQAIRPAADTAETAATATPTPTNPAQASAMKMLSRHIPIVGRALRAYDTVQELSNLLKPQESAPVPPTPAGPTGPAEMWGKYAAPDQQATPVPVGKTPALKGDPYNGPRSPVMETLNDSGTIAKTGYHPESQTAVMEFKNGKVYEYRGVPQAVYDNFKNAESRGSFHAQNIKGRYETNYLGASKPMSAGAKAKQALMNQSGARAGQP